MTKLKLVLTTILLTFFAHASYASTLKYEVKFPYATANSYYPGLDLNNLEKINFTVERNIHNPEGLLKNVKLTFPNATDLNFYNFTNDSGTYRAVANGAWIYKQVAVEIIGAHPIQADSNINLRLYVIDSQSNLNNPGMSFGLNLLDANGPLQDITVNTLADSTSLMVNAKRLNLRLYQKAKRTMNGEGFVIDTKWLGHGDRQIIVPAPFAFTEFSMFNAVAIETQTITHPDGLEEHLFSIKYEDEMGGYQQNTPFEPLKMYLDQVYPPTP